MANNFFLNQDPLLFQTPFSRQMTNEDINNEIQQYQQYQQQMQIQNNIDYIGELDKKSRNISENVAEVLSKNEEYSNLNKDLTMLIQSEILSNIRWKINNNPEAVKNIKRQTELITKAEKQVAEEQRQSLNELNDYVKNYSNITFEEYKKIKNNESK